MLSSEDSIPLSPYMAIYDVVVPPDNKLRRINNLVDFSFVMDELKSKYSLDQGRYGVSPIRMFKYLLIKQMFDLSDRDLVERAQYDMSFKYFLELAPEASVIDPSLLSKFRRQRLQDTDILDLLIGKTVELALEEGILTSKTIIMDATHTLSRFQNQTPKEYLQNRTKHVRKALYTFDETIKSKLPVKPTNQDVNDEIEYSERLIEVIKNEPQLYLIPAVKEKVNKLEEDLVDFQHDLNLSHDPDAKVGYKSEENPFHGYKNHLAMSDEGIITAAVITSGEAADGNYLEDLVKKTKSYGMDVDTVIGDMAYSGKNNLVYTQSEKIQLVSKLHPIITNGQHRKPGFTFNKDADTFACPAGHLATRKYKDARKGEDKNPRIQYFFDVTKCQVCPFKEGCYQEGARSKSYSVTIKANEYVEQEAFQQTDAFKNLYKERYKIEAKNSELKHRHGLKKARTSGLFGMQIQAATSIFVTNLKRIIKLIDQE